VSAAAARGVWSRATRRPKAAAWRAVKTPLALAAAVLVLLWLLSFALPDTAVKVLAVLLTVGPLPYAGPVALRLARRTRLEAP
jgi:hypothetical protein